MTDQRPQNPALKVGAAGVFVGRYFAHRDFEFFVLDELQPGGRLRPVRSGGFPPGCDLVAPEGAPLYDLLFPGGIPRSFVFENLGRVYRLSFEGEVVERRDMALIEASDGRSGGLSEWLVRVDRWLDVDAGRPRLYPLAAFLVFILWIAIAVYFLW